MSVADDLGNTAPEHARDLPSAGELKSHASRAAEEARASLNAIASEARSKVNEAIENQKAAGADRLAGYAQAAHKAASELDRTSPTVARFVRDAAGSVDQFAGTIRANDVRDVLHTVTRFARQQPVAFFAGSVLAGLVLARFLKSDAPLQPAADQAADTTDEGFRAWSAAHPEDSTAA